MGHGFKHGASGTPLNFKVVGNPQPTNPKKNMIWVNTDKKITEWVFAAENPYIHTTEDLYTDVGAKAGYYLNSSGEEVASTSYTNFKEVTGNIMLPAGAISVTVVSGSTATTSVAHGFYDADGKLISTVMRETGTADYDVPTGAASIRISVRNDDPGSLFATYIDAEDGAVWIATGSSSSVEFNALKKNGIQVCPSSAKQYVSGSLVDVAAKVYHDGEWKQMIPDIVLYDRGNEYATITKSGDGTVTKYSDYIQIKTSNAETSTTDANISGVYDLTNYKTLVVEYKNITQTTNFQVQVVDKNNTSTIVLRLAMSGEISSEIKTATADVSALNAEYKLRIRNYSVNAVRTGNVYSLKLLAT